MREGFVHFEFGEVNIGPNFDPWIFLAGDQGKTWKDFFRHKRKKAGDRNRKPFSSGGAGN